MKRKVRGVFNRVFYRYGWELAPLNRPDGTLGFDPAMLSFAERVKPFTQVPLSGLSAFRDAVLYVEANKIQGCVVECGVWRGGASMVAALTLKELGAERDLYLFDTYEGMTAATDDDVNIWNVSGTQRARDVGSTWNYAAIEDVKANMATTGYSPDRVHFVKGPVEDTLPDEAPDAIAVLRLDTDFYESTKHELEQLVPRMTCGAVLLIDDYGHWAGSRKAVDEYLAGLDKPVFLARTDYAGRSAVVF